MDVSPKDLSLEVRVPYHFSAEVNSEEYADVCIRGLEGKTYEVSSTGAGNCNLKSLKGQSINCVTDEGDITCDSYLLSKHGSLVSKKGNIYINKLQGGNFYLRTEQDKELNVKAVYLEKVKMESQLGNIKLGDIHGKSKSLFLCYILIFTLCLILYNLLKCDCVTDYQISFTNTLNKFLTGLVRQ